jgi:protein tyrosine phosphatase (PTP) superfamily phosphohydrolase (DUF442 family)
LFVQRTYRWTALARGSLARALLTVLCASTGCAQSNHNFRAVESGRFYRSGQMGGASLARALSRHHIRTVINLRGAHPEEAWYQEELRVCAALGVTHHDFSWSMASLPPPESLARFADLLRTAEYPVLAHCQAGVHRAAMASSCYLLLQGAGLPEARRQIGLFFFDAPIGRLLDLYEGSALPFDQWVAVEYPHVYARETAGPDAAPTGTRNRRQREGRSPSSPSRPTDPHVRAGRGASGVAPALPLSTP